MENDYVFSEEKDENNEYKSYYNDNDNDIDIDIDYIKEIKSLREQESIFEKELTKNKKKYDEMKKKIQDEIQEREKNKKPINEKFVEKFQNSKNNFTSILKNTKELEDNNFSNDFLKENMTNKNFLNSEKFKLMKNLGSYYNAIVDIFDLDSYSLENFNFQQEKELHKNLKNPKNPNSKISKKTKTFKKLKHAEHLNLEISISDFTKVEIFFRESVEEFSYNEISNRNVEMGNLPSKKFEFMKFDELFNVTKKFSLLKIKENAYRFFLNDEEDSFFNFNFKEVNNYLFIDNHFKIWDYNIILYNEIENRSLARGDLNYKTKFFQINPIIIVS
jgi:hypothetical protein